MRNKILYAVALASTLYSAATLSALEPIFTSQTSAAGNVGYDIQANNVTLTVGSNGLGETGVSGTGVSVDNNDTGNFGYENANVNLANGTTVPGALGFNNAL